MMNMLNSGPERKRADPENLRGFSWRPVETTPESTAPAPIPKPTMQTAAAEPKEHPAKVLKPEQTKIPRLRADKQRKKYRFSKTGR